MRIQQVLFNLVTNAVRFTNKGSVTVKAERGDGGVIVAVADTSQGIPDHELATIFNEFHQVGRPKSEPDQGKGLGRAGGFSTY
ncbi:MAG: sensor histidine kinase [Anaerolineae bacterium]